MDLLDSGSRRNFASGAVRDCNDDKGRCDLLPLEIIGKFTNDNILTHIGKYVYDGDTAHLWGAIDEFSRTRYGDSPAGMYTALLEISKQYADGARKYSDRNWEKGMPLHCYIDSGTRHYIKFLRGDSDEPHDRAFMWNLLGAIWTQKNHPNLIDLPFGEGGNNASEN